MTGSSFQTKINQQGQKYLASIREAAHLEWDRACEHDGMPLDTKFAIFSDDNPHSNIHGRLLLLYYQGLAAYRAGGYVGLKIGTRKT